VIEHLTEDDWEKNGLQLSFMCYIHCLHYMLPFWCRLTQRYLRCRGKPVTAPKRRTGPISNFLTQRERLYEGMRNC